eukprot:scaffold32566_cov60-Phaeocystis_antarctica.AAC.5
MQIKHGGTRTPLPRASEPSPHAGTRIAASRRASACTCTALQYVTLHTYALHDQPSNRHRLSPEGLRVVE